MRTTPTPAPATRAAQPPQRANPLINRDFALLWSGQAVSALGDDVDEGHGARSGREGWGERYGEGAGDAGRSDSCQLR